MYFNTDIIIYLTPKCNSAYGKFLFYDCIITHLNLETEPYSEPCRCRKLSLCCLEVTFFKNKKFFFQTSSLILI